MAQERASQMLGAATTQADSVQQKDRWRYTGSDGPGDDAGRRGTAAPAKTTQSEHARPTGSEDARHPGASRTGDAESVPSAPIRGSVAFSLKQRSEAHFRVDRRRIVIELATMIRPFSQSYGFLPFTDPSPSPQKVHIPAPKRVLKGAVARS